MYLLTIHSQQSKDEKAEFPAIVKHSVFEKLRLHNNEWRPSRRSHMCLLVVAAQQRPQQRQNDKGEYQGASEMQSVAFESREIPNITFAEIYVRFRHQKRKVGQSVTSRFSTSSLRLGHLWCVA